MSELVIRIKLDNATFRDEENNIEEGEIRRMLNKVKDNIDQIIGYNKYTLILRDINGNRAGFAKLNNSLTIEDFNDQIEKRIKNAKDITRSEQDNLIVLLTYLRTYEMEI